MTLRLRVFSDFACPFCYIGQGMIKKLSMEFDLDVTWEPYELHPETPRQGVLLAEKYPELDAEEFFDRLRKSGSPFGVEFGQVKLLVNSGLALQAGEYARTLNRFEEYHTLAFEAYFRDGVNIGEPYAVLDIIRGMGLDPGEVKKAWEDELYVPKLEDVRREAKELEIPAAPTFILEGSDRRLVGAQSLDAFKRFLTTL